MQCERHFLTTFIIPDILLISAFVYGLYIFRWVQTEQLSTLTEAVSALIHKWPWLFHSLNTRFSCENLHSLSTSNCEAD